MTEQELQEKYSPEICQACMELTYGDVEMPVEQKQRLLEYFFIGKNEKMERGPIADKKVKMHEAILVRYDCDVRMPSIKTVEVIERTLKGEFIEKTLSPDYVAIFQNFPGNHILVVRGQSGTGVYEDVSKNTYSEAYQLKIKKAKRSRLIHQALQTILGLFTVFLVIAIWKIVQGRGRVIEILASLAATLPYLLSLKLMKKYYITKYGRDVYYGVFKDIGSFYYFLLIIMAFFMPQ